MVLLMASKVIIISRKVRNDLSHPLNPETCNTDIIKFTQLGMAQTIKILQMQPTILASFLSRFERSFKEDKFWRHLEFKFNCRIITAVKIMLRIQDVNCKMALKQKAILSMYGPFSVQNSPIRVVFIEGMSFEPRGLATKNGETAVMMLAVMTACARIVLFVVNTCLI